MDIPTLSVQTDDELSATQRTSAVASRTTGRRRLNFIQRIRRAAAQRLYRAADRRRDRRLGR